MKILYITGIAILLSLSTLAVSKGKGNYAMSPEQRVERLAVRLSLDPTQQQQVLQIFSDSQEQRESLQEQMQALKNQTHKKISEVLTLEQRSAFATMGSQRMRN